MIHNGIKGLGFYDLISNSKEGFCWLKPPVSFINEKKLYYLSFTVWLCENKFVFAWSRCKRLKCFGCGKFTNKLDVETSESSSSVESTVKSIAGIALIKKKKRN